MIAALGAVVLFLGGWQLIRYTWLPILFLILAVPLPSRYYDMITALQEDKMLEQSERLVYLIQISKEGPTKGQLIEDWSIVFRPLRQQTEAEKVKMRKEQAESDDKYINNTTLTANEVAMSRFGGDEYNIETKLSDSHIKLIEEQEKAVTEAIASGVLTGEIDKEEDELEDEPLNEEE